MKRPEGFAQRLAFVRALAYFHTGRVLTNTEIAKAAGYTQPWATKWSKSAAPPPNYEDGVNIHGPLAAFLGVDEAWLIRGEGDPPEPELWKRWIEGRGVKRAPVAGSTPRPDRHAAGRRRASGD